jgi:hypothetical protein
VPLKIDYGSLTVAELDQILVDVHAARVRQLSGENRPKAKPRTCKYCENPATKTLVWLKDKGGRPARIRLPWCGCDLMTAFRRFWMNPYQVVEGRDYQVEESN